MRRTLALMTENVRRPVWQLLTVHWLSLAGTALVTTAGFSWLFVLPLQLRGHASNPYVGIVVFLILPVIFFAGLLLIPIGIYFGKHRLSNGGDSTLDRKAALRRMVWFLIITSVLNVFIGTQLTYRAIKHMETPQFCGQSCHAMLPEFMAHQNSPHSQLECVECHVAPGAAGWVASKTAGTRQLLEVMRNSYTRPIPSAMETNRLVPATETCESCHWAQKFGSMRLRVINNYAEDEKNTRTQTVLMMIVGGSKFAGIHGAHFGPGIKIRYAAADAKRQTIPWVEYKNAASGAAEIFLIDASDADAVGRLPKYEMQCVDCHNRPTHTFESPERGMNNALALKEVSTSLPFIKKKAMELLKATYASNEEASGKISAELTSYYRQNYPSLYANQLKDIEEAAQEIIAIYNRNVFPDLKVHWGTYPNNLGHTDFPGCFRCHDGSHASTGGTTIAQDCNGCHQLLATDEASPEILKTLGLEEHLQKVQKN
jgi:nitrate/TMAO reductase-like tetraheme cytochrome c subunit